MKIALIVPGGVDRSGRERVIPVLLWLIERIAKKHELYTFSLRQYPEPCIYPLLGSTVINLGEEQIRRSTRPGLGTWKVWKSLCSSLSYYGPFDLIHAFWGGLPGLLAALAARRFRIPSIISLAGGELVSLPEIVYGSQQNLRGRFQVLLSVQLATRVTVASHYMENQAVHRGIKATLIPLGVPPDLFTTQKNMQDQPPWRLLHVASLNRVKDQKTLIEAMRLIISTEPRVQLDIVGEDTLHGGLQKLTTELGLDNHVTFHGFLPFDEIKPLYRQADLFLLTSRHDAAPVAVLEAAAFGVPSVGTEVGYIADWSPDLAWSVPVGDQNELARKIVTLLHDGERRSAMGKAAQDWAKSHDLDWTVTQFEKIYSAVMPRPKK